MNPFRRRKGRSSQAEDRRKQLVERERRRYERERTETEARAEPEAAKGTEEGGRRPLLPETARRTKQLPSTRRRSLRPRLGGLRSASRSGARATVRQTRPGFGRLARRIVAALGWLLAWPLRLAGLVERSILAIFDTAAGAGGRLLAFAERQVTPQRMLVLVIAACAGLLVYSQFVAYRGVEVGQPDYSQVSSVAPAPQTDRVDAGAAHAYVLIPIALAAVAIAVAALATRRWRMGRLVSLLGLAGVAISLAVDLPKGLDAGTAGAAFAGANATLTDGFYAQLACSAVLILCGWVLAAQLRRAAAGSQEPGRPRAAARRSGRAPSVAEGGA